MANPPSPGTLIREWLDPLGLTVTQAAKDLGVTRKNFSALLNGRIGISPAMALRLATAFNTTPESWLIQQMHYDLWQARQKEKANPHRVKQLVLNSDQQPRRLNDE